MSLAVDLLSKLHQVALNNEVCILMLILFHTRTICHVSFRFATLIGTGFNLRTTLSPSIFMRNFCGHYKNISKLNLVRLIKHCCSHYKSLSSWFGMFGSQSFLFPSSMQRRQCRVLSSHQAFVNCVSQ